MPDLFQRTYPPAQPATTTALWLPFRNGDLVVQSRSAGVALLYGSADLIEPLQPGETLYLGNLADQPCLTCAVDPAAPLPDGWRAINLRALYGQLAEAEYVLAGYAAQMIEWQRTSRFCPVCGHTTAPQEHDWGRRCTNCGYTRYPHVAPAVLALVHDGDHILLTHKPGWGARYSIIAGFVEPGESLEACVIREVREEAGLELADVTYMGSQPWPFPHQLMLGFVARYTGGDIVIDANELDDAKWFNVDDLPELPPRLSLSRQLIDGWIRSRRARTL